MGFPSFCLTSPNRCTSWTPPPSLQRSATLILGRRVTWYFLGLDVEFCKYINAFVGIRWILSGTVCCFLNGWGGVNRRRHWLPTVTYLCVNQLPTAELNTCLASTSITAFASWLASSSPRWSFARPDFLSVVGLIRDQMASWAILTSRNSPDLIRHRQWIRKEPHVILLKHSRVNSNTSFHATLSKAINSSAPNLTTLWFPFPHVILWGSGERLPQLSFEVVSRCFIFLTCNCTQEGNEVINLAWFIRANPSSF